MHQMGERYYYTPLAEGHPSNNRKGKRRRNKILRGQRIKEQYSSGPTLRPAGTNLQGRNQERKQWTTLSLADSSLFLESAATLSGSHVSFPSLKGEVRQEDRDSVGKHQQGSSSKHYRGLLSLSLSLSQYIVPSRLLSAAC